MAIILQVLDRCVDTELNGGGRTRLEAMISSYGESLIDDPALCAAVLGLQNI